MELFTLGVGGGYTELDVKEAARAFTGWHYDRDKSVFVFSPDRHDDGPKTFLGETGNFNGDDVLDIIVRHPSTASFVCTKLFKHFVHETPTPADIAPLTRTYFASGYDLRAVMGAILSSPAFYSEAAFHARIKSPVEYVVTALRTLDAPFAATNNNLLSSTRTMGQELFSPPNVKGWPGGKTWMNTMTLMGRVNFASGIIYEMGKRGMLESRLRRGITACGSAPSPEALGTPEGLTDAVWGLLLPGHAPSAATRAALVSYAGGSGSKADFGAKAPGLVSLILSAPEYQLA